MPRAGELLWGVVVRSSWALGPAMELMELVELVELVERWRGGEVGSQRRGWGRGSEHGAAHEGGGHIPREMHQRGLAVKTARQ